MIGLGVIVAVHGDEPVYAGRDMPNSPFSVALSGDAYFDGRTLAFSATAAAEMIETVQLTPKK